MALPETVLPAFVVGWLLGAGLGGVGLVWLMGRARFDARQIAIVFGALTMAVLVGSKLLYLAESWRGWSSGAQPLGSAILSPHMRIPGGIALAVLVGPWIARAIGVAFLTYADMVTPAAGLLIAGIRVGCFLEGCCFGTRSALPWAVRFAPGTDAHNWQVGAGMIHPGAGWSEPVHALQIYFGLVGVVLFVVLAARQRRVRFAGEILLLFGVGYFWSTWLLEFLRALPHPLTQSLTLVAALAASTALLAARRRTPLQ